MTQLPLQPGASAGKDCFIQNCAPGNNYETYEPMFIGDVDGTSGGNTCRVLIKFDLSSIPPTATIYSATLSLWLSANYSANTRTTRAFRQKRAWTETGASWSYYTGSSAWQVAGGFGTDDCEQSDSGSLSLAPTEALGEKQWVLNPSKVQEWVSGAMANNGLVLKADTEYNDAHAFHSSDWTTAGERPKLVVDYTEPSGIARRALFYARQRNV
jgi:hypothetical protein